MWLLPKNLSDLSNGAPVTAAFISDYHESSQICASSLLVRSKPTPAPTWLRKWKRDSWTRHLFGRIVKPSHANNFTVAWTSSLRATHASPSARPDNAKAPTIPAISGPSSAPATSECSPDMSSLKMSKATSRLDSPLSSQIWKKMVTQRRGEYSARLKSAQARSASASSSWGTPRSSDGEKGPNMSFGAGGTPLPSRAANWSTPCSGDDATTARPRLSRILTNRKTEYLSRQTLMWPAPAARDVKGTNSEKHCTETGTGRKHMDQLPNFVAFNFPTLHPHPTTSPHGNESSKSTRRLNPRFVEWLMEIPIGWTDCDCVEMESCPVLWPKLLSPFSPN